MFRISRFAELLKHLPRGVFDRAVREERSDHYRKRFNCWQQLVTMMYAQLSGASSLRVLASGFNAQTAHHYHLGCGAVKRSTLADMNANGSVAVFSKLADALMSRVPSALRADATPLVRLLDSSSITLQGPGFDAWTKDTRTCHTQGMKLHVLLGLNEQAPLSQAMSAPNVNDIDHARTLALQNGAILTSSTRATAITAGGGASNKAARALSRALNATPTWSCNTRGPSRRPRAAPSCAMRSCASATNTRAADAATPIPRPCDALKSRARAKRRSCSPRTI